MPNTFTNSKIIIKSNNLLVEHAKEMHRWLLLTVAIFSAAFSILNFFLGDYLQSMVAFASVIMVSICYLIYKRGHLYISKIINGFQIITMITIVSFLTGAGGLTFMYFFPIIISAMIAFQGKQRMTAYVLTAIMSAILLFIGIFPEPLDPIHLKPEHLAADRLANIIGVTVCCIIILVFMRKVLDGVQRQLIEDAHVIQSKNQELIAALYSRDQMMSLISHDLRSPMAAVIVSVDVCMKPRIDDEIKLELLSQLKKKSQQVLEMTDNILDWSRSQMGNLECRMEPIAADHFIRYTHSLALLLSESKKIQVQTESNLNAQDTLTCDRNMIETVLRNLVSNAVKFSNPGGTIIIRAKSENKRILFEVQDCGKGMTTQQLKNLKEGITFTTNGTANEKGNGFGLQLTQEFLRRHHSGLEVCSTEGKGSTFGFWMV
jgi:signal transduction histidine kinase